MNKKKGFRKPFICKFSSVYHLETKIVNCSIGNLQRSLARDKPKQWDMALLQIEFAYNRFWDWTTQLSPFEIVYGHNLSGVLELIHIPCIE